MKNPYMKTLLIAVPLFTLTACATIPRGAVAVSPFDVNIYLGVWYEIARMDFKFEKDLNNVTATYSLNNDNTVKVQNRGFNYIQNEWKESIGKAKFVNRTDEAKLKVSFFGPFYSGYNVIALDSEYKYALVAGKNLKYLWILSREKTIPEDIRISYLNIAKDLGYTTDELIWTGHDK
ncbi:MAG: lipocalin family protein [Bacteroidales bacterium]|nr:lipocalin family protein [Bacteroidales bacterium]